MKRHDFMFVLLPVIAFCVSLTAGGPDYGAMEAQWKQMLAGGAIIEIHGARDVSEVFQRMMNLSERFTGDYTNGVALAQLSPSAVEEAKSLLQSSGTGFQVHKPGTEAVFATLSRGLFPDLAHIRYIHMEPSHILHHTDVPLMTGGPAEPGSGAKEGTRSCASVCAGFPEGFENHPWVEDGGNWLHYQEGHGNNSGQYFWDTTTCDANSGGASADAVRGGTLGSLLACNDPYPNGLTFQSNDSWMIYNHWIDCAAGASCAHLSFYYTANTQSTNPISDYMGFYASVDGSNFLGYVIQGNHAGAWANADKDLSAWNTLGNLTTESHFQLLFNFVSDASVQSGFGARVDDISITYTGSGGPPSCAGGPSPGDGSSGIGSPAYLMWNSVSGATGYDVYFGAAANPPFITTVTSAGYNTGNLNPATAYYWKVVPFNDYGAASSCPVWSFTTSGGSGGCTGTPIFIAAAAHTAGGGGSQWRTDVGLYNTAGSVSTVSLKFLPQGGDNSGAACLSAGSISANASTSLDDVISSVAGLASGAGGLAVYGTTTLVVNSRTYNQTALGTYGQGIPGHPASQAMGAGSQRVLVQLHENSAYRTNVGYLNTSGGSATGTLTLFDASGTNLGTVPISLQPYEQRQIGQIFRQVTTANIKNGRILITVFSGAILPYASVVDNATGDPTYIEPQSP